MSHPTQIANLLYRYAEYIDDGDLAGAARLFRHARVAARGTDGVISEIGESEMLERWQRLIKMYPPGRPRTKHVITNPIIEVADDEATATCRSYYTVLQQTEELPLQVVAAGRYHDRFEHVDGEWRFSYRDYTLIEMRGDMTAHLNLEQYWVPS